MINIFILIQYDVFFKTIVSKNDPSAVVMTFQRAVLTNTNRL